MENRHPGGRPNLFPDNNDGFDRFKAVTEKYIADRNGEGVNAVSWSRELNVSRQTLYNYKKRSGEWRAYIDGILGIRCANEV